MHSHSSYGLDKSAGHVQLCI